MPGFFILERNKCSGDNNGLDENRIRITAFCDVRLSFSARQKHDTKQPQGHQPAVDTFSDDHRHYHLIHFLPGFNCVIINQTFSQKI